MADIEKMLKRAKLAEQAERYDDMAKVSTKKLLYCSYISCAQ